MFFFYYFFFLLFSLYRPARLIQSLSRDVRLCVCVSVSATFCGFVNILLLPFTIFQLQNDYSVKKIFLEIPLRFFGDKLI